MLQEALQHFRGVPLKLLHQTHDLLKLGYLGIAHNLIQPAFRASNSTPLIPQPIQRHFDLLTVTTPHTIGNDINLVALPQQIQRRLRNTDMCLNTSDRNTADTITVGLQRSRNLGDDHAEFGLIEHARGMRDRKVWMGRPKASRILCRHVQRDRKDFGGAQQLGGGDEDRGERRHRRLERRLHVAEEEDRVF
jgi:hypothetical protein